MNYLSITHAVTPFSNEKVCKPETKEILQSEKEDNTRKDTQPRQKRVITDGERVSVSTLTFANICMSKRMWVCGVCVWPALTPSDEWGGDGTMKENTGQK